MIKYMIKYIMNPKLENLRETMVSEIFQEIAVKTLRDDCLVSLVKNRYVEYNPKFDLKYNQKLIEQSYQNIQEVVFKSYMNVEIYELLKIYRENINIKVKTKSIKYLIKSLNTVALNTYNGKEETNVPLNFIFGVIFYFNINQILMTNQKKNIEVTKKIMTILIEKNSIGKNGRQNSIKVNINKQDAKILNITKITNPMICEPLKWLPCSEIAFNGGYLLDREISKLILLKKIPTATKIYVNNMESYVDKINVIQNGCYYKIKKSVLRVFSDSNIYNLFIERGLNKHKHIIYNSKEMTEIYKKKSIEAIKKDYNCVYYSMKKKRFSRNETQINTYKFNKINEISNKSDNWYWESYSNEKRNKRIEKIGRELNFIYNYRIINKFKSYWNVTKCDRRGRGYITGENNPIASKTIRLLTSFEDVDENYSTKNDPFLKYILSKMYKKDIKVKNLENYINNFEEIIKKKNYDYEFMFYKLCYKRNITPTIYLDATASILQIISIITKDYKLMELCNIGSQKIEDPYDYIESKIDTKENLYIDRKIIKYTIMTHLYGSKPHNIPRKINEMDYQFKNLPYDKLHSSVKTIIKTYNKEFPKTNNFIKFLQSYSKEYIKKDNYYKLTNYDYNEINYTTNKIETKKIRLKIKNINISINPKLVIENSDKKKMNLGVVANTIHSIDSNIITNTRYNLLNEFNVKSNGIHDSIGISSCHIEKCIISYNKELEKLYNSKWIEENFDINIIEKMDNNYKKYYEELKKTHKERIEGVFIKNSIYTLN